MRRLDSPEMAARWLRERGCVHLHADSRRVAAGDGFLAWPGASADGRRFVPQALAGGAAACLIEHEGAQALGLGDDEGIATLAGLKASAGEVASDFHGRPSARLDVVGITGTNGKTSSAWWLAQLLSAAGRPCAMVGTLGMGRPGADGWLATGMTSPDPVQLQAGLHGFAEQGLSACAMEVSSIGLVEGRLAGTRMAVAVFTNLTQDHLDYHGDMAAYWQAKRALFDWPGLRAAVVNIDDAHGAALARELAGRGLDLWTVARHNRAARLWAAAPDGSQVTLHEQGSAPARIEWPMPGDYNLSNLLGVLAAARALGVEQAAALAACAALTAVPGRLQPATGPENGPLVLVDYAHTPDALEKALRALRPRTRQRGGQLWCVVGCGGDRDAAKRPLMAAVAEREADVRVLTSDNPRGENPLAILAQMQAGLSYAGAATIEPDRARAIAHAVAGSASADVVLIAGKGHEDYQEIAGQRLPFSDLEHAQAALRRRGGRA